MLLPHFSFNQTVSAETAKQDKLEIKIEDGIFSGDADDAAQFLRFLGAPPMNQRENPDIHPFGAYFSGQQGHPDTRFYDQPIRSLAFVSGGRRFPPPLVAGHLEIFPSSSEENQWHVKVLATLNPTRFLRHQRLPLLLRPFSQVPPPPLAIKRFERTIDSTYNGEFPLCRDDKHRGDNWIPDSYSWQYYASETSWPTQLQSCLTTWTSELLADLNRAAGLVQFTQLTGPWTYNVRRVEHYWEFSTLTPLATVRSLLPMLRSFSRRAVDAKARRCAITSEAIDNSLCLRVPTRNAETLKIYAKTNNRIRFEVSHDLIGGFRPPGGRHTFHNLASIYPLLDALADVAARRVNEVLRHFRRNAYAPTHHFTPFVLLGEIQTACHDLNLASDLLDILVNNGCIIVEKGNAITSLFGPALQRLQRRRVLLNSNGRYSVTPPYRSALAQMRRGGLGFLFGSKRRLRHS